MKPNILLVQSLQALLTHTLTCAENVITTFREQKLGEPLAHTSCGSHKKPNWIIGGSGKLFDNVNVRCVNVNNGDKYTNADESEYRKNHALSSNHTDARKDMYDKEDEFHDFHKGGGKFYMLRPEGEFKGRR